MFLLHHFLFILPSKLPCGLKMTWWWWRLLFMAELVKPFSLEIHLERTCSKRFKMNILSVISNSPSWDQDLICKRAG